MKKYSKINRIGLIAAILLLFASCQKKFNPDSYAPVQSFGGFGSSSQIQPSNLVGHWAFENSLVDSVSGTVATGVNTTFSTGIKGAGLQGADKGYVTSTPSNAILGLQSFTVSLWVNVPQNTTATYGLVGLSNTADFWGNFDIFFENGSTSSNGIFKYHVENWKTATTDNETWSDNLSVGDVWNKWIHFAVTYDAGSSTFVVYQNGGAINTKVNTGNGALKFQNASALIFGTMQFNVTPSIGTAGGPQTWAGYVPGKMDEIRIYKAALSADEVKALYQLEKLGK
jgi:hypothetical protein